MPVVGELGAEGDRARTTWWPPGSPGPPLCSPALTTTWPYTSPALMGSLRALSMVTSVVMTSSAAISVSRAPSVTSCSLPSPWYGTVASASAYPFSMICHRAVLVQPELQQGGAVVEPTRRCPGCPAPRRRPPGRSWLARRDEAVVAVGCADPVLTPLTQLYSLQQLVGVLEKQRRLVRRSRACTASCPRTCGTARSSWRSGPAMAMSAAVE